jgi:hypothetical protein
MIMIEFVNRAALPLGHKRHPSESGIRWITHFPNVAPPELPSASCRSRNKSLIVAL